VSLGEKKIISYIKGHKTFFILILILVFALFLRLYFFSGFQLTDDPVYCYYANKVLDGEFYFGNDIEGMVLMRIDPIMTCRLVQIYQTAISFYLFGINSYSIAIYPLLASLGSIIVIFYLGKIIFNEKIGLLSAFLLSIFPLNIAYATWSMPDVPIAFYCALSALLFIKADRIKPQKFKQIDKRKILFLLSGIIIGISYLHKVSGAVILLVLVALMLYNTAKKRKIDYDYIYLFIGLGIILLIEGIFYYLNNGDFFTRYNVLTTRYRFWETSINSDFTYYPRNMFYLNDDWSVNWTDPYHAHYGLFYFFIIGSMIYIFVKKRKKALIPLFWFLISFLYLEFGSSSITSYLPLVKNWRYLTVLTISGLLCLSYFMFKILKNKNHVKARKIIFSSILVFLIITSVFYTYHRKQLLDATTYDMKETYEFTKNYPGKTIYCDYHTLRQLLFYYEYENDENIKFLLSVESESELKDSFVVLNGSRGPELYYTGKYELDEFTNKIQIPPPNWELVKVISGPKVDIWATYDTEIYLVH